MKRIHEKGEKQMSKKDVEIPRYMRKVLRGVIDRMPAPGSINHVHVYHDAGCAIYRRKPCDCDADVVFEGDNRRCQFEGYVDGRIR